MDGICAGRAQQSAHQRPLAGDVLHLPYPVNKRRRRSSPAPIASPASTSLVQCARSTMRVRTSPVPAIHTALRWEGGNAVAAEEKAPTCRAWPDGKASFGFPENGTPLRCPCSVRRSGRFWLKTLLSRCGKTLAASAVRNRWSFSRRRASGCPRHHSHQPAARAQRIYKSGRRRRGARRVSSRTACFPYWEWAASFGRARRPAK